IPSEYQYRVRFWGILGAIITRGIFIVAGVALLHLSEWLLFVFGALLIYTGVQMFRHQEVQLEPDANPVIRFVRRFVRTTDEVQGKHFFVRREGALVATPVFVV